MATIKNLLNDSQDGFAATNLWNSICALACTVFFAPLILVVYLLVRADGTPALVSHRHVKEDGTSFRTWRFRTVRPGDGRTGDGRTGDELPRSEQQGDGERVRNAGSVSGRPDSTALGRFLLRTRTNTLPLLYNVVRGELTLLEMLHDA